MKHTAVKICGLTRPEDAEAVNAVRPDCAGFVFAESRRQVDAAAAAAGSRYPHDRGVCE